MAKSAHNVHLEKKNIVVVDDVRFKLHNVKKKENLFSISRANDVPTSLVTKFNKQIIGGNISPDDILFIPVIDKKQVDSSLNQFENLNYALHYVRSKETLSLISRLYSIPSEVIVRNNPSIDFDILQVDNIIVLPLQFTTTTTPSTTNSTTQATTTGQASKPATSSLRQHHIVQGETLYSVSRLYSVPVDSLKKYNPDLAINSVSIGTVINIPPSVENHTPIAVSIFKECKAFPKDSTLNVMVIMPFERKNEKELERTYRYLAFYDGIKLAAEDLTKQGHKINLSLTSSEIADNIDLSTDKLSKQHLVIGLLYEKEIRKILPVLQQHNIPFISAISVSNGLLSQYFNYYQVTATNERLLYNNVKKVLQNNPKNNTVIITKSASREDKLMEKQLLSELNISDTLRTTNNDNVSDDSLELAMKAFKVKEDKQSVTLFSCNMQHTAKSINYILLQALSAKKPNTIIVISDQEPFVTQILSTLKIFKNQYKVEVKVVGSAQWLKFTSLDIELLYNNKIEVAANQHVNYDTPVVQQMAQRYQAEYFIEPTPLAIKGYDIMYYFGSAYHLYGKGLGHCINPSFRQPMLSSSFDMKQACPTCGFENRGAIYLEYTEDIDILTK